MKPPADRSRASGHRSDPGPPTERRDHPKWSQQSASARRRSTTAPRPGLMNSPRDASCMRLRDDCRELILIITADEGVEKTVWWPPLQSSRFAGLGQDHSCPWVEESK